MLFTKRLHEGIVRGQITCTVRIWKRPHVTLHGRYRLGEGCVEVDAIQQIALSDIDGELARRCGFRGVLDLLKVAQHGSGSLVYLIDFHYVESERGQALGRRRASRGSVARSRRRLKMSL